MSDTESTTTRKRVLLTGASGRIGRSVAPALSETFDLRLFDKHDPGDLPGLVVGDLSEREGILPALEGVDTVLHLAAQSTEADFVSMLVPNNVVGLYYFFENAVKAGVKRVVFASTIQAFDRHPHEHTITETDLPRPITLYGATKAFGETMGRWYHDTHGIEFLAVRIGWFLMPDIPEEAEMIRTKGGAHRLWLSPADAVQIFTKAVTAPTIGTDGYGIVHATSLPLSERLSLAPARELLGYEPIDSIRQQIEQGNTA
ncbi:MAG: NAD(P)-dependent oxidoreductase [Armatimonadetes bacterium]|nr:NAD(P)-dependent oxidoreductase [Armatimonadota bacterium]